MSKRCLVSVILKEFFSPRIYFANDDKAISKLKEKKLETRNGLVFALEVNSGYVKKVGINDDIHSFSCRQPVLTIFNPVCVC